MPFVSLQQSKFAFANHMPWARQWASETDYSRLPLRKKKAEGGAELASLIGDGSSSGAIGGAAGLASGFIGAFDKPDKYGVGSAGASIGEGALSGASSLAMLGPIGMAAGALGGGILGAIGHNKQKKAADLAESQDKILNEQRLKTQNADLYNSFKSGKGMQNFAKGGPIPFPYQRQGKVGKYYYAGIMPTLAAGGSIRVGKGSLVPISDDAHEVRGDNPGQTDDVDMGNAMVDNDEVVKESPDGNGERVYSDSLKPFGSKQTFAEVAKSLEKSKKFLHSNQVRKMGGYVKRGYRGFTDIPDPTYSKQNQMVESNLDKLFQLQQFQNGDSHGEEHAMGGNVHRNYHAMGWEDGIQIRQPGMAEAVMNFEDGGLSPLRESFLRTWGTPKRYGPGIPQYEEGGETEDTDYEEVNEDENEATEKKWSKAKELSEGIKDEKGEHTKGIKFPVTFKSAREMATKITKDHLAKNPEYYEEMDEAGLDEGGYIVPSDATRVSMTPKLTGLPGRRSLSVWDRMKADWQGLYDKLNENATVGSPSRIYLPTGTATMPGMKAMPSKALTPVDEAGYKVGGWIGYADGGKIGTRAQRKAMKKSMTQYNTKMTTAATKQFGQPVTRAVFDDQGNIVHIGYATTSPTVLPDYNPYIPKQNAKYDFAKGGVAAARKKPGGSNVGKDRKTSKAGQGPFVGPSGGAPAGSFPVTNKKQWAAAKAYAHNAPNPSGIKAAADRIARKRGWLKSGKAMGGYAYAGGGPTETTYGIPNDILGIGPSHEIPTLWPTLPKNTSASVAETSWPTLSTKSYNNQKQVARPMFSGDILSSRLGISPTAPEIPGAPAMKSMFSFPNEGGSQTDNKFLKGLEDYGPTVGASFANMLAYNKIPMPPMPETTPLVHMERISAEPQLEDARQAQIVGQNALRQNVGQAGALQAGYGSLQAQNLENRNKIFGAVNEANVGIGNREALVNSDINTHNAALRNDWKSSLVQRNLSRIQGLSSERANLVENLQKMRAEESARKLDAEKFKTLGKMYERGILNRDFADMDFYNNLMGK